MESAQELQLKSILTNAVKSKASDIHFSVGNSPILRVGDGLVSLDDQDVITQDFMELLTGLILSEEQKKTFNI